MGYIRKHKDSIKFNARLVIATSTLAFAWVLPFATIWIASTT